MCIAWHTEITLLMAQGRGARKGDIAIEAGLRHRLPPRYDAIIFFRQGRSQGVKCAGIYTGRYVA